uniref:Acyl-CoA-binding domain-containing protein 6 n=1 Tax=Mastacembelus armatus TaxID=205130 RepID=A0A3Q3LAR0_9TELE
MASGSPSSSPDTATGSGTDPARPDTGEPLGGAGSDSDSDLGLSKFDCGAMEMTDRLEGEELEREFESAADRVRDLVQTASRDQLLYLYARYKQVKAGKCNTPKPGFFDFEGQRKWQAWKQLGDMDADQAMQEYISCVNKLDPEGSTKERQGAERRTGFGGAAVSSLYQEEEKIRAGLSCTGPVTEDIRSWCLYYCSTKQTSTVRITKDRRRCIMRQHASSPTSWSSCSTLVPTLSSKTWRALSLRRSLNQVPSPLSCVSTPLQKAKLPTYHHPVPTLVPVPSQFHSFFLPPYHPSFRTEETQQLVDQDYETFISKYLSSMKIHVLHDC